MTDIIYGSSGKNWYKVGNTWINDSPEANEAAWRDSSKGFYILLVIVGLIISIPFFLFGWNSIPAVGILGAGMLVSGILCLFSRIFRKIFWTAFVIAVIGVIVWFIVDAVRIYKS